MYHIHLLSLLMEYHQVIYSRTGTNILVNSPVNNTEYICISTTNDGETGSDPAYIIIAGEHTLS